MRIEQLGLLVGINAEGIQRSALNAKVGHVNMGIGLLINLL
jgi:hypothetical protein